MNLYDHVLSRGRRMLALSAGSAAAVIIGKTVRDAARDPLVQVEALRSLKDRLHPDIIFTLMDLTVEAEALGMEVTFYADRPPSVAEQRVPKLDRFLELDHPDPESTGRMPLFLKVLEELAGEDDVLWGAFVTGPLTLLSQLAGEENWSTQLKTERDLKEALGFATAVTASYASALASRADMVMVVDPAALALPERTFARLYRPYLKGLFGIIRSAGASGLYHVCGDVSRILTDMGVIGAEGILFDPGTDLSRAAEGVPRNIVLIGNLDARGLIRKGAAEEVRWEARRVLRSMRNHPNFILSTGCDLPADTPPRNLEVVVKEVRDWHPLEGF